MLYLLAGCAPSVVVPVHQAAHLQVAQDNKVLGSTMLPQSSSRAGSTGGGSSQNSYAGSLAGSIIDDDDDDEDHGTHTTIILNQQRRSLRGLQSYGDGLQRRIGCGTSHMSAFEDDEDEFSMTTSMAKALGIEIELPNSVYSPRMYNLIVRAH
jgi:hypothetical protein